MNARLSPKQVSVGIVVSVCLFVFFMAAAESWFFNPSSSSKKEPPVMPAVANQVLPAHPMLPDEPRPRQQVIWDKAPEIKSITWSYDAQLAKRQQIFVSGIKLNVTIQNDSREAITDIQFAVQTRDKARKIAQHSATVGGRVPGGVQPKSTETLSLFVAKSSLGLDDYQDLPKDYLLECAMTSYRTETTPVVEKPKPLQMVEATVENPKKRFENPEGFRHPLEAAIRAQEAKP